MSYRHRICERQGCVVPPEFGPLEDNDLCLLRHTQPLSYWGSATFEVGEHGVRRSAFFLNTGGTKRLLALHRAVHISAVGLRTNH